MTAYDIVGYASEATAWRFVADVSKSLAAIHEQKNFHGTISTKAVEISGDKFILMQSSLQNKDATPANDIWDLGAAIFLMVMGCPVMNGLDRQHQTAETVCPYMRSEMASLSTLVKRCLAFDEKERPTAVEIAAMAENEYMIAKNREGNNPQFAVDRFPNNRNETDSDQFWPEDIY